MNVSHNSVKRPVTVLMVFTGIIIFGLLSFIKLKMDVLPDVEYPALTVITVYPGATAEDVEQQVTKKLEKQLSGVSKTRSIKSNSKENVSFVRMEFDFGTEIQDAATDVRESVELVRKSLPSMAVDPFIVKINSAMMPVIIYGISASESRPALKKIIDDKIENRLKQVEGVGSLLTVDAPEREIEVVVDPAKLKSFGISIGTLSKLLETQNISVPGGNIKIGEMDFAVRIPVEFESVDDIRNLPLTAPNGTVIKLNAIADVRDKIKDSDSVCRANGHDTALLMVQKQTGANTLEVAKRTRAAVDEIRKKLPADVKIEELIDSAELITVSISNLGKTAMYAAIFVMLIVLMFLREWKGSLIVILTIPFSMLTGYIFMYLLGYTINIFSLMALAITLGMVVDNSIVVFENITRHIEEGAKPVEASIFGAGEMKPAITASTLTTIAVFIPIAFVSGIAGLLFKQLAFIASITIVASLLISLSLSPMLSSILLERKSGDTRKGWFFRKSEKIFVLMESWYESLLYFTLKNKWSTIFLIAFIFIITLVAGRNTGTDYIPEFDMGDMIITVELETGVSSEKTASVAEKIEKIVKKNIAPDDLKTVYTVAGQTESGLLSLFGFTEGKNISNIIVKIVNSDKRDYHIKEVASVIRSEIGKVPEIVSFSMTAGSLLQGAILGMDKPFEIKVTGSDLEKINQTSNELEKLLSVENYIEDLESTVDKGKPEVRIILDRQRLAALGLNAGIVALTVRNSIYGTNSGNLKQDNNDYGIVLRYDEKNRKKISDLKNITITTIAGKNITLGSVAKIEEGIGSLNILHDSQARVVYLRGGLKNISMGEAVSKVKKLLEKQNIDPEVSVEISGQYKDQQSTFSDMYLLFIISLFMIYAIMASQFQNLLDPFIIMFTVPLSIIGVIWAFLLTGTTLSAVTFIGAIMLLGIVVNNGIVLVDYTNLLRERGLKFTDAVAKAGKHRMRPVLMTALTTIIGMVPMALNSGPGSEIWKPLGITVIGGLSVATVITLFLIPCIYSAVHWKDRRKETKMEGGVVK